MFSNLYNTDSWNQIGSDIAGVAAEDKCSFSVSLNSDGTFVAIGSHLNDDNGYNSGHVRVFKYNGVSWQLHGVFIKLLSINRVSCIS